MIPGETLDLSSVSAHVRGASREEVIRALVRLGVGTGEPVPVWPPRPLPYGIFLSPVRNGWVSLYPPPDAGVREWFPELCALLECPGVLFEVIESRFWIAEFFRGREFVGRVELPMEAVEWELLRALTAESLEAEGVEEPEADEARFSARMDAIARSDVYREELEHLREARPSPEALRPFLPPGASIERAWELLTAMERSGSVDVPEGFSPCAQECMESFASCLGIPDAGWTPWPDLDLLSEGDYDEDLLPEGWREFVVLPLRRLPVL